jgi:hypothetical protein
LFRIIASYVEGLAREDSVVVHESHVQQHGEGGEG